jgi:uncharacterized protein (DUF58 family)
MGRWYVGLTIGIGAGAINTGNNLLFLILGLLLSSIVVSGLLSELTLRGVRVERRLPAFARAGAPALVGLSARNDKPRAPSFSLEVREHGSDVAGSAHLLAVLAGETVEAVYEMTPPRRGRFRFAELEVATRAPFGLFEKARPLEAAAELIVLPRKTPPPPLEARSAAREGDRPMARVGIGYEVHGLRDHRAGEDARSIHWRTSARAGRLIAVEREQERRRRVWIVLDHRGLSGDALDHAVESAAALFEREIDAGAEAGLALCGRSLPPAGGEAQKLAGLLLLAVLEPDADGPAPAPDIHADAIVLGAPP